MEAMTRRTRGRRLSIGRRRTPCSAAAHSLRADARLGRPHEQPARARAAADRRGAARAGPRGADHRARLRPDARPARALRDRAHGRRPPPRRPAGGEGRRASLSRSTALARWARGRRFDLALGHGSNDVTVAARLLRIPCSTMFDYEWATVQHTVNCRLAQTVVVPDAIPPERLARYGATRQDRRLRGPQGGVLPRRLRARPGGPRRARPRPRRADRGRPHAARGVALPPLRERRPRRRARAPARRRRPSSCRARRSSAPSCAAAASSSPSARSTRSR